MKCPVPSQIHHFAHFSIRGGPVVINMELVYLSTKDGQWTSYWPDWSDDDRSVLRELQPLGISWENGHEDTFFIRMDSTTFVREGNYITIPLPCSPPVFGWLPPSQSDSAVVPPSIKLTLVAQDVSECRTRRPRADRGCAIM